MTTIKEINEEMEKLLNETDGDAIDEVRQKYEPFEKNMNSLLDTETIESYLERYEEMNKEDSAPLRCYNLDTTEELSAYIADKEISFDALKTETAYAACEALKFAIYDSEEDYDY